MREDEDEGEEGGEELVPQVEIYRCGAMMEANRVIDELLEPEGIEALVHDRTSHAIPSPAEMGDYFIAVPAEDGERARAVLMRAREAGQLSPDTGELIEATAEV